MATGLEAIAISLDAIAIRLEAIATRLEAIATIAVRLEAIASRNKDSKKGREERSLASLGMIERTRSSPLCCLPRPRHEQVTQ